MTVAETQLPEEFARKIGAGQFADEFEPQSRVDWALRWAGRGMRIFPCEEFIGKPLMKDWYAKATSGTAAITEWWSERADYDIAAVPCLTGHFALCGIGEEGRTNLLRLKRKHDLRPEHEYENRYGDLHMWLRGSAMNSRDALAPGIRVVGPGAFLFLPDSMAPDPTRIFATRDED